VLRRFGQQFRLTITNTAATSPRPARRHPTTRTPADPADAVMGIGDLLSGRLQRSWGISDHGEAPAVRTAIATLAEWWTHRYHHVTLALCLGWLPRVAILIGVTPPPTVNPAAVRMRRPGSRQPLDREFILDAALAIVDTQGAEALTMRALATRLESGTATLYRHFANRAALVAAVIDRVLGTIDSVALSGTWQQVCKFLAQQLFDTLAAHPNLAPLLVEQPPAGQSRAAGREQFLAVLLRDGFAPDTAGRLYATLSHYVLGFAVQLRAHAEVASTLDISGADPIRFPATARTVASGVLPMNLAEEFTYGLDLILGIDRLEPIATRPTRTARR